MGPSSAPKADTDSAMETSATESATCCSSGPTNSTAKIPRRHPLKIAQVVAEHYSISFEILLDFDRHQSIVEARTALYWILRRLDYSYPEIGRITFRDHTTAMAGVKKAEKWRNTRKKFRETTDYLLSQIQ